MLFAEVPDFYAAVERADDPALAERPVIVGGDPRKNGRVQAASDDALAAGVTLEMTVREAMRLCPRARAVRTNMSRYREVSRRLFACLRRAADRLEPFGLGAAYFDFSGRGGDVEAFATELRARVEEEVGLSLRVGIATAKFLARVAAEEAGPSGVRRVTSEEEAAFLRPLPVGRLDGVGRKTAATLAELGALTIGDVVELGRDRLEEAFGTHGLRIFSFATGADDGPVRAAAHAQSLSREATLADGSLDLVVLSEQVQDLAQQLEAELGLQGLVAVKVTLKLRYADQVTTTRSRTLAAPISGASEIHLAATGLFDRTRRAPGPCGDRGAALAHGSRG